MSVKTRTAPRPAATRSRDQPRAPRPTRPRRRRWRRVATFAALLALVPALMSFAQMLGHRSDSSFSIRTVEWLRDNGARGLVNRVESLYYSTLGAPSTGGPQLKALPHQSSLGVILSVKGKALVHIYRPPRIHPIIHPALPGEGAWHATFAGGGRRPPVLITSFRPDPNYPDMVAGVAWIDASRTTTWLYPGLQEPAVQMASRGPMEVPTQMRSKLVATFNSGFKLADSGGGFASGGHTYAPLKDGLATFVRYTNGAVDIRAWTGASVAGPNITYARQNLPLIVENGHLNPNLSDGPEWGATLGNAVRVWRSGVGVDSRGDLIYAAAPIQTVASLAQILREAGAVRAMELDINTYWPSFISYRHPGAAGAANLLPSMDRSPLRYLTPDDRDFFAVYLR